MITARTTLIAAACTALTGIQVQFTHAGAAEHDEVPQAIGVPAGQVLAITAHAVGVQIYECMAGESDPSHYAWTLKGPKATLRSASGKALGTHYAGPTWEGSDGSKVVGELVEKAAAPDAGAIPWLLLRAKSSSSSGLFAGIVSIQRLRTVAGVAPAAGCDRSRSGREIRVPYSAQYRFYKMPAP